MKDDTHYCPARLAKIVYSEQHSTFLMHLEEVDGNRHFAVAIGQFEMASLVMGLQEMPKPRPLTHDLLLSTIAAMGGSIKRLNITRLEGGTYYAELVIEVDEGEEVTLDCRPSDGMVLAANEKADLFVSDEVFEAAID